MKWALWILGVFAVIVAVVYVVGLTLPEAHVATRSARIAAPPQAVWEVITDVQQHPGWRSGVDSVEMLQDQSGRLAWRETSGGDRIAFVAEESVAPARLVTRITDKSLPFGGSWEYRIENDPGGSRVTITENGEVYNPIFRFASRFVIGHSATIDKYLADLAAHFAKTAVPALPDSGRG